MRSACPAAVRARCAPCRSACRSRHGAALPRRDYRRFRWRHRPCPHGTGGQTRRIRLAFIDAPETTQPHGMESRAALAALVDGREAEVEIIDTDRYRREVARLRVDGRDVNFTQVQNGHAWHYRSIAKHNQRKDDYAHYATAEQYAREQRIGLWRQPDPTAPWDHRRTRRKADKPQ
nr:thermonuclease family protein [Conchiformibius kuhniae]